MSKIRSKQISDFSESVTWANASSTQIPSAESIKNQFIAQDQLAVDVFVDNYSSGGGTWSVTLSEDVLNDDPELVTIYVNGVKTNGVQSVTGSVLIIGQYGYDIDINDSLKIHYVKSY